MKSEGGGPGPGVLLVHRDFGIPSPRVTRAEALEEVLLDRGGSDDEGPRVIRWPAVRKPKGGSARPQGRRGLRHRLGNLAARTLVDRHEPKMWWGGRSLPIEGVDAGLVVSMPASAAVVASRQLVRAGIPYVVDQGDPWGIGAEPFRGRGPAARRRRRLELRMWKGAAGGVFTTRSQAEAVLELVPTLPHLIRINGYRSFSRAGFAAAFETRKPPSDELRLVHFGSLKVGDLTRPRMDPVPALASLAASAIWERVTLTHFGHAPERLVRRVEEGPVSIEVVDPVPWDRAIEIASGFDAAVVVGNRPAHRTQVPSKVLEYLTLPIPRIALSSGADGDELSGVAASLPGYLAVPAADPDLPGQVDAFLRRDWAIDELVPPDEYSWNRVAADVTDFFLEVTGVAAGRSPAGQKANGVHARR